MTTLEEFITNHISKSESLNSCTSVKYALTHSGYTSTGTMDRVYDVSVYKLKEMYEWVVGKYTTYTEVFDVLKKLGYRYTPGLPLNKTGVYGSWIEKPIGLFLL